MSTFGLYSKYYDLLYRDKDYAGEVSFVTALLDKYRINARTLLELGCGTGRHAALLGESGHSVHGIDSSNEMLEAAYARTATLPNEIRQRLTFSLGDVRAVKVEGKFDAAISLFHVASYQTTNHDLLAFLENAETHLSPGGIFIFDYWHGPAVLTERPSVRIKRMESDEVEITRIAEPKIHLNESVVDVNYQIFIRNKLNGITEQLHEQHRMRYFFPTEIELLAKSLNMQILESCEWMSGRQPDDSTWGVCTVLRK